MPARVYATDRPAFAAMHAFSWSSDEGVDIVERGGKLYLQIPKYLQNCLNQAISIYRLRGDSFVLTEEEVTGNTYHVEKPIEAVEEERFNSVIEAVEHFGGEIELI